MIDIFKKLALMGLGAISLSEEKLKDLVKEMEAKGEVSKDECEGIIKNLLSKVDDERKAAQDSVLSKIREGLGKIDIATKDDITKLEKKIKTLDKKLKTLLKDKKE